MSTETSKASTENTVTRPCYHCNTVGKIKRSEGWLECPQCKGSTTITEPITHALSQDGKETYRGTENGCYHKLQREQGQSSAWAFKYGGWAIRPI